MAIAIGSANIGTLNGSGGASTTGVLTTTGTVSAGGTVILACLGGTAPSGAVDNSGLGYGAWALDKQWTNTNYVFIMSMYCSGGLASGTQITITWAGATGTRMAQALWYSGGTSSSRLDQNAGRAAFGEGAAWTTGSITPSEANTIVFGVYSAAGDSGQSSTADSGWTEWADFSGANNSSDWLTAVYQIVPNTSARNPSGVMGINSGIPDQAGVTVNYKAGTASGPPQRFMWMP